MAQGIPTAVAHRRSCHRPTSAFKAKSSRDFEIGEEAMRVLILAVSVLGILVSADAAKAGPSTTDRNLPVTVDQVAFTDETTQQTEDQIGLDKRARRNVQRSLTGLGFGTRISGKFDDSTRAAITRWQEARGYPQTGFLNTLQHEALLADTVSAAHADASSNDNVGDGRPGHPHGASVARHHRGGGGPGGLIGGVVGGLFGRR